jgi:hypothetical protein
MVNFATYRIAYIDRKLEEVIKMGKNYKLIQSNLNSKTSHKMKTILLNY